MAEYIEKGKAMQIFCADCDIKNLCTETLICMEGMAFNGLPTIDIVRCKDCAYWESDWNTSANDPNWHYCSQNDTNFEADEFCSRGKRKEVEDGI